MKCLLSLLLILSIFHASLVSADTCTPLDYEADRTGCPAALVDRSKNFPTCSQDASKYNTILDTLFDGENLISITSELVIEVLADVCILFFNSPFNSNTKKKDTFLNMVFLSASGQNHHSLSYYLIEGQSGNKTEVDFVEEWTAAAFTSDCTQEGDTIKLGPFGKGDKISFYYRCNEYHATYCSNPTSRKCSAPSHDPSQCEGDVFFSPFYDKNTNKVVLGVEDFSMSEGACCTDLIFGIEVDGSVKYSSLPVFDEDPDEMAFCYLRTSPDETIGFNNEDYGLFGGKETNSTSFSSNWLKPSTQEVEELLLSSEALNDRCIMIFDTDTQQAVPYGTCGEDDDPTMHVSDCFLYSANVSLIFKKLISSPRCFEGKPATHKVGLETFGLFKGHYIDRYSIPENWLTPTKSEVEGFVTANSEFSSKCLFTLDLETNAVEKTNCPADATISAHSNSCYYIPENAFAIFKMKRDPPAIDNSGGRCVGACEITEDVVFDSGSVFYMEDSIVSVSSTLELKEEGTIDIVGNNSLIQTVDNGLFVINGGTIIINIIDQTDLDKIEEVERLIATGNLNYNGNVTIVVNFAGSIDVEKDVTGEAVYEGTSLTILFTATDKSSGIPWWGIFLITLGIIIVLVSIFIVVAVLHTGLRNKIMPFR